MKKVSVDFENEVYSRLSELASCQKRSRSAQISHCIEMILQFEECSDVFPSALALYEEYLKVSMRYDDFRHFLECKGFEKGNE